MSRPTIANIKLSALRKNVSIVKSFSPRSKLMAVIKSDAYGHGAINIARVLQSRVDALAVATIDEALFLRESDITLPILVLEGVFSEDELQTYSANKIMMVVHNSLQIDWLEASRLHTPIQCWLKLDTGMSRLGFEAEEVHKNLSRLKTCTNVNNDIVAFTHLACADDRDNNFTLEQLHRFEKATQNLPILRSAANSAGVIAWPSSHFDWVRPGYMLYGNSPLLGEQNQTLKLQPVMSLLSEIIAIRNVSRGGGVGYGSTWKAQRETRIATVCVGYGDGYPRSAPSGTPVLINGHRAPIVGRVSMDMITVDITDITACVGDKVTLWGEGLPLNEIASLCNTIGYELTARMPKRVPRIIVDA